MKKILLAINHKETEETIKTMVREMFEVNREYLPQFKHFD